MLVVPNKRALIVKVREPEQVLACIPTAKRFVFQGQDLLAVPHRLDETKVLRNIGADAPSPVNYYHEYPKKQGRFDPFSHQKKTVGFLTLHSRCVVLNEPRTGKTLSCMWAYDYLRKQGKVRKMLIVAPLSTLDPVWAAECFESFWWYKAVVVHGSREKRLKLLKEPADVFIVNHHGFSIIQDALPEEIDVVTYDEAAVMRNPSSNLFKSFNSFVRGKPNLWLWLLTGTPTPNEPTDAWALCRLIGAKVPSFSAFKDMVMHKMGMWTWVPRPNATEIVSQYMQPAIRFTRDECFDLPDNICETRKCDLSPEQKKHYDDMLRKLQSEVGEIQVTAVSEAAKIQKLLQILLGCVYTDTGDTLLLDASSRVSVIKEVIAECSEKVIVMVPFTGALHALADELRKDFTVEVVNGTVSKTQRDRIFKEFQNTATPRVLVADARTLSHGLDLTAASTIIWAGPTNSNETYQQACARVLGPKQKHKTSIVHVEATELERRIFKRLHDKQSLQGLLLDIIQAKGN